MSEWRDGFPALMREVAKEMPPDVPERVGMARAVDLYVKELRHFQAHLKERFTPEERRVFESITISGGGKCSMETCGVQDPTDEGAHRRRALPDNRRRRA